MEKYIKKAHGTQQYDAFVYSLGSISYHFIHRTAKNIKKIKIRISHIISDMQNTVFYEKFLF